MQYSKLPNFYSCHQLAISVDHRRHAELIHSYLTRLLWQVFPKGPFLLHQDGAIYRYLMFSDYILLDLNLQLIMITPETTMEDVAHGFYHV